MSSDSFVLVEVQPAQKGVCCRGILVRVLPSFIVSDGSLESLRLFSYLGFRVHVSMRRCNCALLMALLQKCPQTTSMGDISIGWSEFLGLEA